MNANDQFFARDAHVDAAAVAPLPEFAQDPRRRLARRTSACRCARSRSRDTPASLRCREESAARRLRHVGAVHRSRRRRSTSARACRALRARWIAERGDTEELDGPTSAYGRARLADPELAGLRFDLQRKPRRAQGRAPTSRRCTTRGAASSRRRWNSSRSARTCSATRCWRRCPRSSRASIRGRASARRFPTSSRPNSCATKSRAAARSSRQHQPSRSRADDHRPQLPREDQRQHRQLRGVVVDRRGSREDDVGDPLGRATR